MKPVGAWIIALALCAGASPSQSLASDNPKKALVKPCTVTGVKVPVLCGWIVVQENHARPNGRTLPLKIRIIPGSDRSQGKATFFIPGGPGQAATDSLPYIADPAWERQFGDIVLVDGRGTGEGNKLDCKLNPGEDLQRYLDIPYSAANARTCLEQLSPNHDLTQYSTAATIADMEEVRKALGYESINLEAGSFGTYVALQYIRLHPDVIDHAFLVSPMPIENKNPLFHAREAQRAIDAVFDYCEGYEPCRRQYPALRSQFHSVLADLQRKPKPARIKDPSTGREQTVLFTRDLFADTVRVAMYAGPRGLPALIAMAARGEFDVIAQNAFDTNKRFYANAPLGIAQSVLCTETVARIKKQEIEPALAGSYLGGRRLRGQLAACKNWPKSKVPAGFFSPFRSQVPTIFISGTYDPVLQSGWPTLLQSYLPNSKFVRLPTGHSPFNECVYRLGAALFATRDAKSVDTTCATAMNAQPLEFDSPPSPPGR